MIYLENRCPLSDFKSKAKYASMLNGGESRYSNIKKVYDLVADN